MCAKLKMMNEKIVFIDHIGRTLIGTLLNKTEKHLVVRNPIILHVQPNQGELQVQTFPLFFFEFIDKDHREKNDWTFSLDNIVLADVVLNPTVVEQYNRVNNPSPPPVVENNPKVISIDDL